MLPSVAPIITKSVGRSADMRIDSDACATGGGPAASIFVRRNFKVFVYGIASATSLIRPMQQNGIFVLEVCAMGAAVVSLGEQLRGKGVILLPGKTASPGVFFESPGDPSVDREFLRERGAAFGIVLGGRSSAVRETCGCAQ